MRNVDGSYGTVTALTRASARRVVYNLTVAEAATFFVGDDGWLVHHAGCGIRSLTSEDIGLQGIIDDLKGTFTLNNDEAIVFIDMIEGVITNPLSILKNLEKTARAEGAKTLRIEAYLANTRLNNILIRRYGMQPGIGRDGMDVITIFLD